MSTFTIRVTSSATNTAGTAYGQQPDLGAPSFFDLIVSGNNDGSSPIPNGVYDAYCLNPLQSIIVTPTSLYSAQNYAGNTQASFVLIGFSSLTQTQVDQLNWLLAQNFTSDAKYGGQFNFGEVQTAIWRIVGFTDAQIAGSGQTLFLNDNNRNVISVADINFLIASAQSAVASGNGVLPADAFFTTIIDPVGTIQPLIVQLQSAKLGNYVWLDANADGLQNAGEVGVDHVIVQLYDTAGNLLATTQTGDDFSTTALETGYYQFTGLKAGDYQVKFITPADMALTVKDANANAQDAADSDASQLTGFTGTIHLNAGESNQTIDAGLHPLGSISGVVYNDADNNGFGGDALLAGSQIALYQADGVTLAVGPVLVGANGEYSFTNLALGNYVVKEVNPVGFSDVADTNDTGGANANGASAIAVSITAAAPVSVNNNFLDIQLGSISGVVYNDADNNGFGGDALLAGSQIALYQADGVTLAVGPVLVGASGEYSFTNLALGNYVVKEVNPVGFSDVADSDGNANGASTIAVTITAAAPVSVNNNFLDIQLGSISGVVYNDADNNGFGGDALLAGSQIALYQADGVTLAVGPVLVGASGEYSFTNLALGNYVVKEVNPVGFSDVADSDGNANGASTIAVTITAAAPNSANNNFLDVQQASLGDRLWVDTNGDGQQNDGVTDIVGQTVTLIGGGGDHLINGVGDTIATTTTDTDGVYYFTGLNVGEQYQVQFNKPVGTVFTKQNVGSDTSDSDVDLVTGKTQIITLAPGENNATLDAGVYTPASIGDFVWYDKNANGIQDTGETGIGGVKVTLTGGGADGLISTVGDNTTLTTTTGTNGLYLFDGLTPGTQYQAAFDMPVGFNGVSPRQQGLDTAKDSDGILSNVVVLTSGQFNQTIDAGFFKAGIDIEKWVHSQTTIETPGDAEGLTPGFWKNHTGLNSTPLSGWPETGHSPTDSFEAIFGVNVSGSNPTLLDALSMNGGGENALLRHSAAALLNASDPYVDYAYTVAQVIAMTQAAYANGTFEATKNLFATQNELGADLTDLATSSSTVVNGVDMDADLPGSGPTIGVGDKAVFTYVVTNTGDSAIGNVVVTDNRLANVTYVSGDVDHDGLLDLTETWTYTATETVSGTGQIGNIGTVTGTSAVAGGPNVTDSDAAYYQVGGSAVVGDKVWEDTNANGIQDVGENGIAGVTVLLKDGGGNTLKTTTTDVNGNYIFDVTAGVYSVAVVPPSGYLVSSKDQGGNDGTDSDIDATTKTTAAVTITNGEVNLSLDAGLYRAAELGDRVWLDANKNGIQDTGEAGVSGVKVTLLDAGGVAVGSPLLTDASGNYLFTGLKPGTYSVQFDKTSLPVGYVITTQDASGSTNANDSDASSVDGKTIQTVLDSGESDRTWDMGVQTAPAAIGDRVWLDSNGNGLQDSGEVGVANVTVKLLDAGGAVLTTQTTDINGNYLFSGLNPGNYAVQFAPLAGYGFTAKDAGADGVDSDADIITGKTITTTLAAGEVDRSWDAGLTPDCRPVTFDFSGNSATDGTDGNSRFYTDALTGVSVTARAFSQDKGTNTWQSAWLGAYGGGLGVTDSSEGSGSGNTHTVDNVGRNNYIVLQFSQAVEIDKAYLGYVSGDSDVQVWVGNFASTLTTMSNAVLSSMSFSEVNTTIATGARWADLNVGEVSGNIVIIAADTTDTSPEDYFKLDQVAVCAPNMGTPVAKASIGDFVWEDKNYNGVQDSGETGIANVTVKLLNSAGIVVDSTTTDASGKYLFDGLNPADYKVQVVAPSGYYVTKMDKGTNNAVDSDVNSAGITAVTTLSAGENDLSWDAGLYRKVSVGDKVWDDMNHNNIQDASEPGIANIKVNLMNASGTSVWASTTTNANGNYLFANLDPGTYVLQFDKANVQHYNYGAWYNMSNWKWAVKDTGTNDAIDSDVTGDATATTNVTQTSAFTLVSGQNDMTKDAGITPIAIDLNGDGIHTVSRANSEGTFDLLGNGKDIQSGWLSGDDGFLAIDSNGNGLVDNISELFGGLNKGDGFSRLGSFDSNGDGLVNFRDNDFAGLKIWQDLDGNHKTDADELLSLTDAGVTSLNVHFNEMPFLDAQGNLLLERGSAALADGSAVEMTDVYFNVSAADAGAAGVEIANMASLVCADPLWMV